MGQRPRYPITKAFKQSDRSSVAEVTVDAVKTCPYSNIQNHPTNAHLSQD